MPTNWTNGNPKREKAWSRAKEAFISKHGRHPSSDDDWATVMGTAEAILKNMGGH